MPAYRTRDASSRSKSLHTHSERTLLTASAHRPRSLDGRPTTSPNSVHHFAHAARIHLPYH